ncbi:MAG: hypothetical protein A2Y40_03190 [Candidatus Margulisbacteria bacterium GWF2_35_9]|nr:MAG: hypothetical protein A2Y40_03190 [Candidatus Margulisbacteria bacterium GWF2_35_9]
MTPSTCLKNLIEKQAFFENSMIENTKKIDGVYFTNSINSIENILSIVDIDSSIIYKRILEPSCGHGILLLKLISSVYEFLPDRKFIDSFISKSLFFVDIQKDMIDETISNIKSLYFNLFKVEYTGKFNSIIWDFTDKIPAKNSLFDEQYSNPFINLYGTFDYVIGNPPYISLYGRRDKKRNEQQRITYLNNYMQFPSSVKNGKINFIMLFIEHSLDFLKTDGKLSFIIDLAFFETAYLYTRKFLLENTIIEELTVNIKDFDVASGQVIIKLVKSDENHSNIVKIIDHKTKLSYSVPQMEWYNKNDEYKFRYNGSNISKIIIAKILSKKDKTLKELFPKKNLRTCVMLLDMEDKFTNKDYSGIDNKLIYPYYQGSKSLTEKYGNLSFSKYFYYNKTQQDYINDNLKIELEKKGIKNKKRLGLGEPVIYDNPKIYIRQSAKSIIATIDLSRSSANSSLYVFSLRTNSAKTIEFLYFLCGWINSDLITYYSQQMNIIRFSQGKQPQIKISDLSTIFIPQDEELQKKISDTVIKLYETQNHNNKKRYVEKINSLVFSYYGYSSSEIGSILDSIKSF